MDETVPGRPAELVEQPAEEITEDFEVLREARRRVIRDMGNELPHVLETREHQPASVSMHAAAWRPLALLGRCVNVTGDGRDLDDRGDPRWSWAVGVQDGDRRVSADGTFTSDLRAALRDLESRLPRPLNRR